MCKDVTKHEDVEQARDRVVEVLARTQASVTPRKLAYVIPNAGVAHFGTVEGLPMESARAMFDTNLYVLDLCLACAWPVLGLCLACACVGWAARGALTRPATEPLAACGY